MALWTPEYLKHTFWMDASNVDNFVFSSGSLVQEWKDCLKESTNYGNSGGFYQGTTSYQPTRVTGVLNSEAVIRFDGVDNRLVNYGSINNTKNEMPALAIFAVATNNGGDTNRIVINISTSTISTNAYASLYFTASTVIAGGRRLASDSFQYVELGFSNTSSIVSGLFDYTNAQLFVGVDGVYVERTGGFQTSGTTPANSDTRMTLGALYNNSSRLNGDIAEVIALRYIPTEQERFKIEGYLAHKYGLTGNLDSGHIYKTNPPTIDINWTLLVDESFDYTNGTDIIGQSFSTPLGNIEWRTGNQQALNYEVIDNELHSYVDSGAGWLDALISLNFGTSIRIRDYTQGSPPPLIYIYDYNGNGFYANGRFKIEVDIYITTDVFSLPSNSFSMAALEKRADTFVGYKDYSVSKEYLAASLPVGLNTVEFSCLFDGVNPEYISIYISNYLESPYSESDLPVLRGIRVYSANDLTPNPFENYTLPQLIGAHLLLSGTWEKPTDYLFALLGSLDPITEIVASGYSRLPLTPSDANWSGPTSGNGSFSNLKALQFRPMDVTIAGWGLFNPNDDTWLITRSFATAIVCTTDQPGPYFPSGSLTFSIS